MASANVTAEPTPPATPPGPPATPPGQPPARGHRPPARRPLPWGEVTAEVDNPLCRNLLWGPTQTVLRARWDWAKMPRNMTSERLSKMPNIPGLLIIVNCRDRTARVVDPLSLRENQPLLRQVAAVWKSIWNEERTFVPTWERRGLSDDDMATWLYWLWREQDAGHVRVLNGKVPSLAELVEVLPDARIRQQFYDSLAYRREQQETAAGKVLDEYEASIAASTGEPLR